ncbi:MAG: 8-amino-7-oxononanoate synthase, partial [Verrucomicrobiota bacterium]
YRSCLSVERGERAQFRQGDRPLWDFGSNDYLGLAAEPEFVAAFQDAIGEYGVGAGASRLITGTHSPHRALEDAIADFKRAERAITFASGFATAIGAIPALVGKGDVVILDKLCHACLIDGARLSGAAMRVFPHNDLEKAEQHLQWARKRVGAQGRILLITESVFSMDGDVSDLKALVALKEEFEAVLLVDEAHAVGCLGPQGRGWAEEEGVATKVDLQMGTFSKALGCAGGYLAGGNAWIELLINRARSFIFSTAVPPALADVAHRAIQWVGGEWGEERRGLLRRVREAWGLSPEVRALTPIVPFQIGDSAAALAWSERLKEEGFWVPAIRFPTVPKGTERLRVSLRSTLPLSAVRELAEKLHAWQDEAVLERSLGRAARIGEDS